MMALNYTVSSSGKITFNDPIDPADKCDFTYDWTSVLTPLGDSIASVSAVVTGATKDSIGNIGMKQTVWISAAQLAAGTVAIEYTVNTTNTPPRTFQRTLYVKVKER